MSTVFAVDIRRRCKVLIDGVVHLLSAVGLVDQLPRPVGMRCGYALQGNEEFTDLGDDVGAMITVTCVACVADRRWPT